MVPGTFPLRSCSLSLYSTTIFVFSVSVYTTMCGYRNYYLLPRYSVSYDVRSPSVSSGPLAEEGSRWDSILKTGGLTTLLFELHNVRWLKHHNTLQSPGLVLADFGAVFLC